LSKRLAFRRDDRVALFDAEKAEQDGSVHRGQQRVNLMTQLILEAMAVRDTALVGENFEQASQASGPGVREHDDLRMYFLARTEGSRRSGGVLVVWLREDAIDRIGKLHEAGRFAIARMGNVNFEIGVNVRRIAAENDDAVGKDDGFFDIVSDDE